MSALRSDHAVEAWKARYVAGKVELAEMEAGVERALCGAMSDEEWVQLCLEERFRRPITGLTGTTTISWRS